MGPGTSLWKSLIKRRGLFDRPVRGIEEGVEEMMEEKMEETMEEMMEEMMEESAEARVLGCLVYNSKKPCSRMLSLQLEKTVFSDA